MKKENSKDICIYCNSYYAVKNGKRMLKFREHQRYICRSCNKSFTLQPSLQTNKTYNLKTILDSISNYNLGKSLRSSAIPKSTIHNWIKTINLPMHRLRNNLKNIQQHEIILKHQFIHHKQPFLFQYHNLKLQFAKKFPELIDYLTTINTQLPKDIFNNSKRISEISKKPTTLAGQPGVAPSGVVDPIERSEIGLPNDVVGLEKISSKQNYAVKLAEIASQITTDNKKRHEIIENFMLINDTATIATEIPIYLKKEESNLNQNLTGHIDILQIRYHKIYLLDFKPEPVNKTQTINQLKLYKKALSKRTKIPEQKIKLAFFNKEGYYEV